MRSFFILLRHELRMLFFNPTTYVASVLFLCLMGFAYYVIIEERTNIASGIPPSTEFFQVFWLPVFFVVPLLTMKSIAGDRRQGLLVSLKTTRATATGIVFSKYLSAYLFYLLLWLLTLIFPLILVYKIEPNAAEAEVLSTAPLLGGYLFIAVSGLLFIAVGIFTSSVTRNELIAGMLSLIILFSITIGGLFLTTISIDSFLDIESIKAPIEHLQQSYIQVFEHLDNFSVGVIDTRPFFFYGTNSLIFLGLSVLSVEYKNQ